MTDRILGSGAFAKAFMAIEQTTRTQIACKIIDLKAIGPRGKTLASYNAPQHAKNYDVKAELEKVRDWGYQKMRQMPLETKLSNYFREFEILHSISHPNIIALDKVFVTNNNLYIFQDLLTGGDLYSYLNSKNNNLLEVEVATIVWQILMAVQYLHDRNIVHRDLKPENIMLTSLTTGARVVLTNFSSARKVAPFRRVDAINRRQQPTTTDTFDVRPKGLGNNKTGNYPLAIDMWSVGMVTVLLLFGVLPFNNYAGKYDARLATNVDLKKLESSARWTRFGERPKSFTRGLLVRDEADRMTVKEALDHAWFSNAIHQTDFDELYQRTVKHIRPRVPSLPVIEFVKGKCNSIRYLECSRKILSEPESQSRESSRSRNVPVEPPYKPFPRKMHEQGGLWPKRRKTRGMSEEVKEVIANDWLSDATKPVGRRGRSVPTGPAKFKKPNVPALVRSVTSGKKSVVSFSELQRSLNAHVASSAFSSEIERSASSAAKGIQLAVRPSSRQNSASKVHASLINLGDWKSPAQDVSRQQNFERIWTPKATETSRRRHLPLDSKTTSRIAQTTSAPDSMLVARGLRSASTLTPSRSKLAVALNVSSKSKLNSRSRSRSLSTDSFVPSTPSRKRRGSLFDFDVDDDRMSGREEAKQMSEGRGRSRNNHTKANQERMDQMVWAHEDYLRMTDEEVE